jgi:hypothetical protein
MREYTHRPEEKPFPVPCLLAGSKLDRPAQLSADHSPQKLLTKIARNEQIYCEQKFAHGESILLTENHELPFILLAI